MNDKHTHTLSAPTPHALQNQVFYCTYTWYIVWRAWVLIQEHLGSFPSTQLTRQIQSGSKYPTLDVPPPTPELSATGPYKRVSPIVYASTGESPNIGVRVQRQTLPMQVALAKNYKLTLKWVCQTYTPTCRLMTASQTPWPHMNTNWTQ